MAAMFSDVGLLARLVAFDSTSAKSNLPLADFICEYLDGPDVTIVRNDNAEGTKTNLVIRIGGKGVEDASRGGLILSGHMDTVPATEPEWQTDPFELTETDDAYVGRGACDMKGFDALAINLARRAVDWPLRRPLVLILTFDEELGTYGAHHFVETWEHPFELPHSAIIGEPTSLRVVCMHKGLLKMRITFRGQSAHTGYPHLGLNAIEPAGRVITALADLGVQLRAERTDTSEYFSETPFVSLTVATITGGTALNIVPDLCELGFGARLLPGMESAGLIARIRETLQQLKDLGDYTFEVTGESPPLLTAEDTEIHRRLCAAVDQTRSYGVSYATDGGPLQRLNIESVLFGPGDIAVAHKPNEFLPKREFARAGTILERTVKDFCVETSLPAKGG